jgi:hypothetical protein
MCMSIILHKEIGWLAGRLESQSPGKAARFRDRRMQGKRT